MFEFFKSRMFNFESLRLLSTAPYGGSEICEFLEAVGKIKQHDPESWHRAWLEQATRAEAMGDEAAKTHIEFAACAAYLRSMNYYRASQFMFNDRSGTPEPRCLTLSEKSISMFQKALVHMETDVRTYDIPYDGLMLPSYLYLPQRVSKSITKAPVIICIGGADVTQEELYFLYPAVASQHGYAVFTFEGPGQGIVLRRDKCPMVPDFETVTRAVVDFIVDIAHTQPELQLDVDRIVISGATFGGFYALRAASDPRIKACISIDPFYSMYDLAATRIPNWYLNAWQNGWVPDGLFDFLGNIAASLDFPTHWEFNIALWMFGVEKVSWAAALREMKRYSLSHGGKNILHRVTCPVLVTGATYAMYATPEMSTDRIHNDLINVKERDKRIWIASQPSEGGLQAKLGAWSVLRQKSFEFLDDVLDFKPPQVNHMQSRPNGSSC